MRGIEEHSGDIPVLNLLGHRQEGLLDVCGVLGRRLEEGDVQLIGKFLHNAEQVVHMKQTVFRHTFAALYSTTFLLVKSDLLPTRSLLTPSDAYLSISWSHCLTFVKVSRMDEKWTDQYTTRQ